jgi:hypothetical protein
MPLEFPGQAVLEAETGALRFAGFPTENSCQTQVVICRIAKDAIKILCPVDEPSPKEALLAFERHSQTIYRIASAEFDCGNWRPTISANTLMSGKN